MSDFSGRYGVPGPSFARLSDLYTPVIRILWPIMEGATAGGPASPELMMSLGWVLSGFEPDALAPDGGEGLFSMRPADARRIAIDLGHVPAHQAHLPVDLCHPQTATYLAALHLNDLFHRFDHNVNRALLAFRLGVAVVERDGDALMAVPEHAQYLHDVLSTLAWLCEAKPWQKPSTLPPAETHAYQIIARSAVRRKPGEVSP